MNLNWRNAITKSAQAGCTGHFNIERKRPLEFYIQLKETNKFIELICSYYEQFIFINVNIDLPNNAHDLSYDAVHFTQAGHDKTTNICLKYI